MAFTSFVKVIPNWIHLFKSTDGPLLNSNWSGIYLLASVVLSRTMACLDIETTYHFFCCLIGQSGF